MHPFLSIVIMVIILALAVALTTKPSDFYSDKREDDDNMWPDDY